MRSGHKIGKSTSAAILLLWFLCTKERALVVLLSSSGHQVKNILWKEVRRLYHASKLPLGGEIFLDPATGLRFADGRKAYGLSTDKAEKAAGVSGPNNLYILDEASGIAEPIFEAMEGNRAGGESRMVMFSNPTQVSGTFYESFTTKRDYWHGIHVRSDETPNCTGEGPAIPGLANPDWVAEKKKEWGVDSALYHVRVLGNFPLQASNAIIGLGLVEEAMKRWESTPAAGRLEIGVDVARFGDDETVIVVRRGNKVYPPKALRSMDGVEVAGKVLEIARALRRPEERVKIKIDGIGVGASPVDILSRAKDVDLVDVNVSKKSDDEEDNSNLRTQLWFGLADWLRAGGTLPPDKLLEAELVAATYTFDTQGRRRAEPKDKIKERIQRSPDRADALALAVYSPPMGLPASAAAPPTRRHFDAEPTGFDGLEIGGLDG